MRSAVAATVTEALEGVDVECTHCGLKMTAHLGSGGRIRYFRCGACHRWVSSSYADVLRADAHLRTRAQVAEGERRAQFDQVKLRLEKWLVALEEQDPYRVLGISPLSTPQQARERYRELAFRSHPDRGGSAEQMRELNLAWERILHHQERAAARALPSPVPVDPPLPASAR